MDLKLGVAVLKDFLMDHDNNVPSVPTEPTESLDDWLKRLRVTIDSIKVSNTLAELNPHERDGSLLFEPGAHKYEVIGDSNVYISVTTWNSTHFNELTEDHILTKMMKGKRWKEGHAYWGMTVEQIKANWKFKRDSACLLGECMHKLIEYFLNRPGHDSKSNADDATAKKLVTHADLLKRSLLDDPLEARIAESIGLKIEWNYFIRYIIDSPGYVPYRTEWRIYHDELKICGTIDIVYQNPEDGTLIIGDWKRVLQLKWHEEVAAFRSFSKIPGLEHIPDLNYWHYVLQLNVYKLILEQKYGKVVSHLYLFKFHPNTPSYEVFELPVLHGEMDLLVCHRLNQLKRRSYNSPRSHAGK